MASENITLLAIGFSLLALNILFGPRTAAAIARIFRFFGVRETRPSRLDDYEDVTPASASDSDDSEAPSHSISGVRVGKGAGAGISESPRKVAGTRR
jgi:hypothetical protein